jgi:hypothetical protein
MKTVAKIIDLFGGLEWLRDNCIRLENPPYMRLVIEYIGEGPRGLPAISVAHYHEQNGDLMRHPEMGFEVSPELHADQAGQVAAAIARAFRHEMDRHFQLRPIVSLKRTQGEER